MRAGLFVFVSACAAVLALAAACSSFGSSPGPLADAASDTTPTDGGGLCTPPQAPPPVAIECQGSCAAAQLFEAQVPEQAVVAGKAIFIVKQGQLLMNADVSTGAVFTQVDPGQTIKGKPSAMAVDDDYVYVSTDVAHVRVRRSGGLTEPIPLRDRDLSPVFVAKSAIYQMQPSHVIRTPKNDPDGGLSQAVNQTDALAVDGDEAYWIGLNTASDHVILGAFPNAKERAVVKAPVQGFVVRGDLAYVAEPADGASGSTISRIALRDGTRSVLVNEPGKIEALYVKSGRVYWLALRAPTAGDRVFASVDVCGGPSALLATELPVLTGLSFDDTYAYAATKPASAIYRMRW